MNETVTFPSNGGTCGGELFLPDSGSGPGVVVIQEWWGLNEHVLDVAGRFAAAGFVALAPDLYRGDMTREPDEAKKLMMGLDIERVGADLAGAAAYLRSRPEVASTAVGAVGFCMGGGLALLAPTVSDDIVVSVGFYPAMPWPGFEPDWSRTAGKTLVIHGAEDDGGSDSEALRPKTAAVEAAGGTVVRHDYPGSHHAFYNDTRPEVFQPEFAQQAFDRTLAHLREALAP